MAPVSFVLLNQRDCRTTLLRQILLTLRNQFLASLTLSLSITKTYKPTLTRTTVTAE
jgi:hypothetical protein